MRLPAKASIVTSLVGGATALAVQCVAGDVRAGAVPVLAAEVGVQEMVESVRAETDVPRRPRKSWMPRWRITSAAVEGMPNQRAIATAKPRRPNPQKTTST